MKKTLLLSSLAIVLAGCGGGHSHHSSSSISTGSYEGTYAETQTGDDAGTLRASLEDSRILTGTATSRDGTEGTIGASSRIDRDGNATIDLVFTQGGLSQTTTLKGRLTRSDGRLTGVFDSQQGDIVRAYSVTLTRTE